ncbi:MAG: SAM-dependent chlorinase/fluorinase [Solirubrobacterales bacterium]
MIRSRPITFLTDFGVEDEFSGVCRAVIDRFDPEIRVIDVTHGINPGDVRRGALALAALVHYSAPAVHLAVVDPGVGTDRRALALCAGDHFLVGPDNGLLVPAADRLGGADRAFEISESPARLVPTHRTFHGRDIFSPVAAELARGLPPEELGIEIDASSLVTLDFPEPSLDSGLLVAHVLAHDRYGNLALNVGPELILQSFLKDGASVTVEAGGSRIGEMPFGSAFGEVETGSPILFPDSSGSLALAVNGGSAAKKFDLAPDDELLIRPA